MYGLIINMPTIKNTINTGITRTLIFKERRVWYGLALELNVMVDGDDPREVSLLLQEAITGFLISARKEKLPNMTVNQKPDKEYEILWNNLQKQKTKKPIKSPFKIYSAGLMNLSTV